MQVFIRRLGYRSRVSLKPSVAVAHCIPGRLDCPRVEEIDFAPVVPMPAAARAHSAEAPRMSPDLHNPPAQPPQMDGLNRLQQDFV